MTRRRFRAVPGIAPSAGFQIGISMGASPAQPRATACPPAAASVYDRIKGPFHQRQSREIGVSTTIDTFVVFMYGFQEGDSVLWVAPSSYEGAEESFDGTVTIADPSAYVTTVTFEYPNSLGFSVANIACIVNGALLIGCVEIGSGYGS